MVFEGDDGKPNLRLKHARACARAHTRTAFYSSNLLENYKSPSLPPTLLPPFLIGLSQQTNSLVNHTNIHFYKACRTRSQIGCDTSTRKAVLNITGNSRWFQSWWPSTVLRIIVLPQKRRQTLAMTLQSCFGAMLLVVIVMVMYDV